MCIFSRFSETCIRIWGSMFLKIDWKYTYKVECIFWILNSENWPRIHIPVPVDWWHADCARRAHMQKNSSTGLCTSDQAWSDVHSAQAISADLGPGGLTHSKGELRWEGHSASDRRFWTSEAPTQTAQNDLKSTYCFCAHMHEITKYFLFTENQEQCLNPVWHQASAQPDACMIDQWPSHLSFPLLPARARTIYR